MKLISVLNTVNPNGFIITGHSSVNVIVKTYSGSGQWSSTEQRIISGSRVSDVISIPDSTDTIVYQLIEEINGEETGQINPSDRIVNNMVIKVAKLVKIQFYSNTYPEVDGSIYKRVDIPLSYDDFPTLGYDSETGQHVDVQWTDSDVYENGVRYIPGDTVSSPLVLYSTEFYDIKPCNGTIRYIKEPDPDDLGNLGDYWWKVQLHVYWNGQWIDLLSAVNSLQYSTLDPGRFMDDNLCVFLPQSESIGFWSMRSSTKASSDNLLTNQDWEDDENWGGIWENASYAGILYKTQEMYPNPNGDGFFRNISLAKSNASIGAIVLGKSHGPENAFIVVGTAGGSSTGSYSWCRLSFLNNSNYDKYVKIYIPPVTADIKLNGNFAAGQYWVSASNWRRCLMWTTASRTISGPNGEKIPDYSTVWNYGIIGSDNAIANNPSVLTADGTVSRSNQYSAEIR